MNRALTVFLACTFLFTCACLAADSLTADEILKRAAVNQQKMNEAVFQYTWREHEEVYDADRNGAKVGKARGNKDYDIVFLVNDYYRKPLLKDGKPLTPSQAQRTEADLKKVAAQRRKGGSPPEKLYQPVAEWCQISDLLRLTNSTVLREEEIDGRKAWVIESKDKEYIAPRPPRLSAGPRVLVGAEHQSLISAQRAATATIPDEQIRRARQLLLWIDQQDFAVARQEIITYVLRAGSGYDHSTGGYNHSTVRWTYKKQDDGIWLLQQVLTLHTADTYDNSPAPDHPLNGQPTVAYVLSRRVTETKFYDYKKRDAKPTDDRE